MVGKLPPPSSLEIEEIIAVTGILVSKSFFPNPAVVAQFEGPVLPSIRGNRQLGSRGTVIEQSGASILLDDNTTPRWSLLLAHGFGPNYPASSRGWSLAHIWPVPQCPHSYTQLANLALVPFRPSSLTDAEGPAAAYLQFHSWQTYGWHPPGVRPPNKLLNMANCSGDICRWSKMRRCEFESISQAPAMTGRRRWPELLSTHPRAPTLSPLRPHPHTQQGSARGP